MNLVRQIVFLLTNRKTSEDCSKAENFSAILVSDIFVLKNILRRNKYDKNYSASNTDSSDDYLTF